MLQGLVARLWYILAALKVLLDLEVGLVCKKIAVGRFESLSLLCPIFRLQNSSFAARPRWRTAAMRLPSVQRLPDLAVIGHCWLTSGMFTRS